MTEIKVELKEADENKEIDFKDWLTQKVPASAKNQELLALAKKNAHPRDEMICFDEVPHDYYIYNPIARKPIKGLTSITRLVSQYHEEFDADAIIEKNYGNWSTRSNHKYYGKTKDEIKALWNSGNKLGTFMHRQIELFYNGVLDQFPEESKGKDAPEFKHFLKFNQEVIQQLKWTPYRTEWRIWSAKYRVCGTIDCVFIPDSSKPNEIIIYDWKRVENLSMTGFNGKKMHKVLSKLDDCNYTHYCLQLNSYKKVLEDEEYGFKVVGMYLGVFHPSNLTYIIHQIPASYKEHVDKIFDERLQQAC